MSDLLQWLTTNAPAILKTLLLYEFQVTVFVLIVWGIDRWLRRAASGFRYALWLVVLVKALWPPSFTIPGFTVLPSVPIELPALAVTATAGGAPVQQSSMPLVTILLLLWGLMSAGLLLLMLISFVSFRLRLRAPHAYPWQPGAEIPSKDQRWPPIWYTDRIPSPLTMGLIRPRIYLTPAATESDPATLAAILHHELAHVRRRDGWVTLLQGAALVIHPFNPLIWLMNRRLTSYREQVCDDFALRHTAITPREYGRALIDQLGRSVPTPLMLHPKTLFFETKRDLKQRLQQLLTRKEGTMNNHTTTRQKLLLAGLMAGLLLISSQCQEKSIMPSESQPTAPTGPTTPTGEPLSINPNNVTNVLVSATGQVIHDDELIPLDQLHTRISNLLAQNPRLVVSLKADQDTPIKIITDVQLEFRQAGATRIFIVNAEPEAPPPPTEAGPNVRFVRYDSPPAPIGDYAAVQQNVVYPEPAKSAGIEGTVIIQAFIDDNGQVTETIVLRGLPDTGLDEAAVEALKGVSFEPAKNEGKPVGVWISFPIRFSLNEDVTAEPKSSPEAPASEIPSANEFRAMGDVLHKLSDDGWSPALPFTAYDSPPEPIGGYTAIQQHVVYPEPAKSAGIEGSVIVQAFVDENGQVTETIVLRGLPNTGLDEAALAALKNTTFKPAQQEGKPVGVWISIPVHFQLTGKATNDLRSEAIAPPKEPIYDDVKPPQIIGGALALQQQLVYPAAARAAGIEGKVFLSAFITKDGKAEEVRVVENFTGDASLAEAAVAAIRNLSWEPALELGSPVDTWFTAPVTFRLGE
ncbi:TonB family protein [Candidatus Neomarinimicrobiota bacterium]